MTSENSSVTSSVRRELRAFKRMPFAVDVFGGICAAIAYRLAVPPWIIRLLTFVLIFFYGTGLCVYLLLWIFVPRANKLPGDYAARTGSE